MADNSLAVPSLAGPSSSQFTPPALDQQASNSSNIKAKQKATKKKRRYKVALGKGRGLMDWIRFSKAAHDLAGTSGNIVRVTAQDMLEHSTRENAWMVLRKKVFNITPFIEFHPGGVDPLLLAIGADGTSLFNEFHPWVNFENMLKNCFVGFYVGALSDLRKVETRIDMSDMLVALPSDSSDEETKDTKTKPAR